jgi:hypothetical protein
MSDIWQWILIMLTICGASVGVVTGVLILFLFAGLCHLKEYCSARLSLS